VTEVRDTQLYSASTRHQGDQSETALKTEPTARMTEEAANNTGRTAARMTGESASKTSAGDRGKCPGATLRAAMHTYRAAFFGWRKVQAPGNPGNPPQPGFPGSPDPSGPSRPEGALRGHNRLTYHADPGADGNQHITAPAPGHRPLSDPSWLI
jgi:hypothetical protein